eukprot:5630767-Prymnesium_polylepis.1
MKQEDQIARGFVVGPPKMQFCQIWTLVRQCRLDPLGGGGVMRQPGAPPHAPAVLLPACDAVAWCPTARAR